MNIEELLKELHIGSIQLLLDRIKSGEATAAELSVAVKLLKDHGITSVIEEGKPIFELAKNLPFKFEE